MGKSTSIMAGWHSSDSGSGIVAVCFIPLQRTILKVDESRSKNYSGTAQLQIRECKITWSDEFNLLNSFSCKKCRYYGLDDQNSYYRTFSNYYIRISTDFEIKGEKRHTIQYFIRHIKVNFYPKHPTRWTYLFRRKVPRLIIPYMKLLKNIDNLGRANHSPKNML